MRRICPVFRADVEYEASCIRCECFDAATTGCKVITGEMKARNENGVIVVQSGGKHGSTTR